MKKTLGLLAALTVTAGLAIPAAAAPGGPCQGNVDAMCTYRTPSGETRQCDYWINEPAANIRNFCGELPGVGPIV